MRTSALFGTKKLYTDFLKFMVCPHKHGEGVVRTFFGQGEGGSIFRDFVQTSFMDAPEI